MTREVVTWRVNLDVRPETIPARYTRLSEEERGRSARLHLEQDRRRFIVAHAALRDLLARTLGIRPQQVRLVTEEFGKPALSPEHRTGLTFNLSHSAELALIALAWDAPVGVDIERVRAGAEYPDIARRWFSSSESLELRRAPEEGRAVAFLECWTKHEAWAKARGDGLAMAEADFALGPDPGWSCVTLRPAPDYVGALAVEGRDWRIRERWWHDDVPSGNVLAL